MQSVILCKGERLNNLFFLWCMLKSTGLVLKLLWMHVSLAEEFLMLLLFWLNLMNTLNWVTDWLHSYLSNVFTVTSGIISNMKYLILRSFLVACFSLGQGEFGCKLGCHIRNYRNCRTLPMSSNRKQNFLKIEWEVCPSCLYNIFYMSQ